MIGERNVVEIIFEIVDVEGGPAAIAALHALDPFAAAGDRDIIFRALRGAPRAIHRHHHDGGVVEVGIIGVVVLEGPAAGANIRPLHRPVALDVQHLLRQQPVQPLFRRRQRLLAAGFDQGMTGQRGVPHRRNAGLAIGLVLADHQKLVDAPSRDGARRIIRRLAEHLVHHHGVGHRRIDRAEAVFAVQPLLDERDRADRWRGRAASWETAARSSRKMLSSPRNR